MDRNGITKKKGLFFFNAKNKQKTEMKSKPNKIISCLPLCESVNIFTFLKFYENSIFIIYINCLLVK